MRNRCLLLFAGLLSVYMVFHSCQNEQAIRTAQYTVNGKKVYTTHCQNCHGAKGEGLGALYPPLTDSTFLTTHRVRSEEHTSELQSLMRISYAVFCLKKKKK